MFSEDVTGSKLSFGAQVFLRASSPISRPLIEKKGREADWVFVMEPGRGDNGVITSRGAVGCLIARAEGRTAHAGNNFKDGISAVREFAGKIEAIESLSNPDIGLIVNIGIFRGEKPGKWFPDLLRSISIYGPPMTAKCRVSSPK